MVPLPNDNRNVLSSSSILLYARWTGFKRQVKDRQISSQASVEILRKTCAEPWYSWKKCPVRAVQLVFLATSLRAESDETDVGEMPYQCIKLLSVGQRREPCPLGNRTRLIVDKFVD